MSNKSYVYVLTKDLNFFYKLNKALLRNDIKFKILNTKKKRLAIPRGIVLTTREEFQNRPEMNDLQANVLAYHKGKSFEGYFLRVLAACRVGFKEDYSQLTFSIDPGTKKIGLATFLDDYYLNSHTFHQRNNLLEKIHEYVRNLQTEGNNSLVLHFKFGEGVRSLTFDLISKIFSNFTAGNELRVSLIDESKSSKVRICNEHMKRIPKHEASALVLASREGIQITKETYQGMISEMKAEKRRKKRLKKKQVECNKEETKELKKIAEGLLKGTLSLSQSLKMTKYVY